MDERVSPIPRLAAAESNVGQKAARGGHFSRIFLLLSAVREVKWQASVEGQKSVMGEELEVTTITYYYFIFNIIFRHYNFISFYFFKCVF